MTTTFRKHHGRFEDWHFHENCPDWPEANYIAQRHSPPASELCIECQNLHNSGKPSPNPSPECDPPIPTD